MDTSKLNFDIGKVFSSKVFDVLGSWVTPNGKPAGRDFFLLVSFSRNRFRLTEDSVGLCLQSVLGGNAFDFNSLKLEDQIFRFTVSSKKVGLLILELSQVAEKFFKLAFFLCNDSGFQRALRFAKMDSGPSFSWEPAYAKKSKSSYVEVVKANCSPLTGANSVPMGTKSSRSTGLLQANELMQKGKGTASVFSRLHFPHRSVFERLSSPDRFQNSNRSNSQRASSAGGSKGPHFSRPDTAPLKGNISGSSASPNYSKVDRVLGIKCWHCKSWGHSLKSCNSRRNLQKFISMVGENPSANFSSYQWENASRPTWFKGKATVKDGPAVNGPSPPLPQDDAWFSLTGTVRGGDS
jgi:hypothetical protein